MSAANRDDVSIRLGDPWGDYSKSYFATGKYGGIDLSAMDPGTYTAHLTARFGRAIFSSKLDSVLTVDGRYGSSGPMLSVGVIGSCISRDNFSSAVISNWKKYFRFHGGQYQMSLVSLMADAVELPAGGFGDLDAHARDCTIRDFTKAYLAELEGGAPDVVIIDFLADARYGCLRYNGSLVTNNKWKMQKSEFYLGLPDPALITMDNDEASYLDLFREAVRKFEKFRAEYLPETRIVINSARAVESHIDGNKKVRYPADYIRKLNGRLDILQRIYLEEVPHTPVLDDMMKGIQSSKSHPWGPGQVHFESEFYQRFQRTLKKAFDYRISITAD